MAGKAAAGRTPPEHARPGAEREERKREMPDWYARTLWWRVLGGALALGGAIDLAAGIALLARPGLLAGLMGIATPRPTVYLHLAGVLLAGLGVVQFLVAWQARRLAPVAAALTLVRFATLAVFLSDALAHRAEPAFAYAAGLEGLLGMAQLLLLRRAAGSLVTALAGRS
ncbi:MAG: hypothetical protein KBD01_12660 [Acidobacteria bacterium]|nr:hypothetical protein [Acidobacteriota bacterium]